MSGAQEVLQVESRKASALLLACRYRCKDIVKGLLSSNASIGITDRDGRGSLHNAIGDSAALDEKQDQEVVDILRLLVDHHASVTATDETQERMRPLHYAALIGQMRGRRRPYITYASPTRMSGWSSCSWRRGQPLEQNHGQAWRTQTV